MWVKSSNNNMKQQYRRHVAAREHRYLSLPFHRLSTQALLGTHNSGCVQGYSEYHPNTERKKTNKARMILWDLAAEHVWSYNYLSNTVRVWSNTSNKSKNQQRSKEAGLKNSVSLSRCVPFLPIIPVTERNKSLVLRVKTAVTFDPSLPSLLVEHWVSSSSPGRPQKNLLASPPHAHLRTPGSLRGTSVVHKLPINVQSNQELWGLSQENH